MEFSVTTGKEGRVEVFFGADGRLTDAKGQVVFTDKIFAGGTRERIPVMAWLLNLAYMTLGRYPGGVPQKYLISPSAFESKENIGRLCRNTPIFSRRPVCLILTKKAA